jgi:hypothetical protein
VTTAGLWTHFYLTVAVVLEHGRTRNAIWGELRAVLCGVAVVCLWVALDWRMG